MSKKSLIDAFDVKKKVIKVDTVEIRIKSPERKVRKRKLFSFLDEVENE